MGVVKTTTLIIFNRGFKRMKKINKPLSAIANSPRLSSGLVFAGVLSQFIGAVLIISGCYYNGLNKGVELRDDYYYKKEKQEYERKYGRTDNN